MAYSWNDLFANVGGTVELVKELFAILMFAVSQHIFYVSAIKKVFLGRQNNKNFKISLGSLWSLRLFLGTYIPCIGACQKKVNGEEYEAMEKLYKKGKRKI